MFRVTWMVSTIFLKKWNHKLIKVNLTPVLTLPFNWFDLWWDWQACKKIVYNFFHFGPSKLMCQIKLLGVVGGVLGRNTLLIFQQRFAGKSVFLINQFTFWNFSIANTIKCIFADWRWWSWLKKLFTWMLDWRYAYFQYNCLILLF